MPCLAVRYVPVVDLDARQDLTPTPLASTPSQATFATAPAIRVLRFPSLTLAMIGLLVAIFAAELAFGVEPTKGLLEPSVRTLLALGGLQYTAVVGSEEWYRMFLAPLMHAGPVHLLLNGIALYLAGRILEPMIGARWFAALFVVSGLAGAFSSLVMNAPSVVSVGASGAIMGLFAAIWVLSYRFADPASIRMRTTAIQVLILSMVLFASTGLAKVDIAALGVAGVVYGATQIPHDYKIQSYAALLFPPDRLPATDVDAKSAAEGLVSRYPRDPRGHLYRALALIDAKNLPRAEGQLRTALADGELLKTMFKPAFAQRLETLLAVVLLDQRKTAEARETAQPVCAQTGSTFRDQVAKYGLCGF